MANFFSQNIRLLREQKGLKQHEMQDRLGFARTTWSAYEQGRSQPDIDGILRIANFFGVAVVDLLDKNMGDVNLNVAGDDGGEGYFVNRKVNRSVNPKAKLEPIGPGLKIGVPAVVTVDTSGEENVAYVPVKARAGYLLGYSDPEFMTSLPAYAIPGLNHGTFRAFEVDGHSMFNTLHDHDTVIGRWASDADLRDDRVYVLVTKNDGVLVKRCIFREGKIIAKSDNNHKGEYPPIVIEGSELLELWYVVQRWTRQLSAPGEIYKRVVDLEAKITLVEERLRTL
jgi:transcriptional regulator with XRE-family HTH domain